MNDVSVILTIHNQVEILEMILKGILDNISPAVKELIFVLDGCNDGSEQVLNRVMEGREIPRQVFNTPNVWEVKANNVGLRNALYDYSIIVQDDMLITEKNFDVRMLKPFKVCDNLLGVTGRNAQNERIVGNTIQCYNVAGRDANPDREIFSIRDVIVRGPIMFKNSVLKELNYLDEEFAPLDSDDKDLSYRAWRLGYKVGAYVIDYKSPSNWGTTRKNPQSNWVWTQALAKNIPLLIKRHSDLMSDRIGHNEDIFIGEDYD